MSRTDFTLLNGDRLSVERREGEVVLTLCVLQRGSDLGICLEPALAAAISGALAHAAGVGAGKVYDPAVGTGALVGEALTAIGGRDSDGVVRSPVAVPIVFEARVDEFLGRTGEGEEYVGHSVELPINAGRDGDRVRVAVEVLERGQGDGMTDPPAPEDWPKCRVCGCWEFAACEGGCHWVEPDLCSACAERADGDLEGLVP